ncbi:MAG: hypothetical protein SGBAC_005662 [Bacillariaceae sp.]
MAPNLRSDDYYQILGVPRGADDGAIRKAYKKLAVKWHPDKNPGDEEATTNFQKISEAYATLTDEKKRRLYDQYGKEAANQSDQMDDSHMGHGGGMPFGFGGGHSHGGHGGHGGMSQEDAARIFAQFFGGGDPFGGGMGGMGGMGGGGPGIRIGGGGGGRRGSSQGMHGDPFASMFGGGGMGGMPMGGGAGFGGGRSSFPSAMPQRPREKRYDAIPDGTVVSLKGLVSKPEKNGDRGEVQQYDPRTGRYIVVLEDTEETMKVKPSNLLQHVHVKLHGLESKPEWNGEKATIIAWDAKNERYNVYVIGVSKAIGLFPSNVILENGTVGMITGLQSKPELNGKFGTIKSFNSESGRYDVQLSKDKVLRLKLENIHAFPAARQLHHPRSIDDSSFALAAVQSTEIGEQSKSRKLSPVIIVGKVRKGIDIPYAHTIQALKLYHGIHGDLILPRRYVIPESDIYPSALHGIDLAGTVYHMKWWQRHVKQRPDRVSELNSLGFVWERLQPEWNLVLEGLLTYGTIHGNLLVPSKFVIPYETNWPKSTWGLALGNCVHRIRTRGEYLQGDNAGSRREQLDSVGFIWCTREHKFEVFCRALRFYSQIEVKGNDGYNTVGVLKVPYSFVIPTDDDVWPKYLWGYRLGEKCTAVRQKQLYVKGHPKRLKVLLELGFHIAGNDSLRWLEVVHASAVYSQLHGRVLNVPLTFVVPAPPQLVDDKVIGSDDAWPWPEYLWGFPLGQRLKDIRLNGNYLKGKEADERRSQLNALGFVWSPKRGRRKIERRYS